MKRLCMEICNNCKERDDAIICAECCICDTCERTSCLVKGYPLFFTDNKFPNFTEAKRVYEQHMRRPL